MVFCSTLHFQRNYNVYNQYSISNAFITQHNTGANSNWQLGESLLAIFVTKKHEILKKTFAK